ncbi:MAG: hypothetical protein Q8P07_02280 [bacterium]|nr:hypothetical protein [bacterium]
MVTKVTTDELAGMVKRGFDSMDNQFKGVDRRFDKIEDRLESIENLMLKRHDREIGDLKLRMQNLEDMLAMPSKK